MATHELTKSNQTLRYEQEVEDIRSAKNALPTDIDFIKQSILQLNEQINSLKTHLTKIENNLMLCVNCDIDATLNLLTQSLTHDCTQQVYEMTAENSESYILDNEYTTGMFKRFKNSDKKFLVLSPVYPDWTRDKRLVRYSLIIVDYYQDVWYMPDCNPTITDIKTDQANKLTRLKEAIADAAALYLKNQENNVTPFRQPFLLTAQDVPHRNYHEGGSTDHYSIIGVVIKSITDLCKR